MNIQKLMESGDAVFIVSGNDLKEFALFLIGEARKQPQEEEENDDEVYLTEEEVKERLHVAHSTLWRWNNIGYLRAYKWGRKNMYKESDIQNLGRVCYEKL